MAVGVIDLVLEDARGEIGHFQHRLFPLLVEAPDTDAFVTRNIAAEEWHAQTSLPISDRLVANRLITGVEEHAGADLRDTAPFGHTFLHLEYKNPQRQVHLRAGQADAFVLVHRLDHVVDQRAELACLDIRNVDVRRFEPQNGMPETADFEDGHAAKLSCRPW